MMSRLEAYSPKPATKLFALALPTLKVVLGSLLGGKGACVDRLNVPIIPDCVFVSFLGNVAYCLLSGTSIFPPGSMVDLLLGSNLGVAGVPRDTTVIDTKFPDFLIRSTTCSCEAEDTSSLLISKRKSPFLRPAMSATPPGSTSSRY